MAFPQRKTFQDAPPDGFLSDTPPDGFAIEIPPDGFQTPEAEQSFSKLFPTALKTVTGAVKNKALEAWRTPVPIKHALKETIDLGGKLVKGPQPSKWWSESSPMVSGATQGVTELAEGLTTPENAAFLAGSFTKVPQIVHRLISGGFGAMMARDMPELYGAYKEAAARGDREETARLGTLLVGQGVFTLGGFKHAFGKEAPMPIRERIMTPEEQAIYADQNLERPSVGADRMLPAPEPAPPGAARAVGAGAIIPPAPQRPPVMAPSKLLEGPPAFPADKRIDFERLTGKTPELFREDQLAKENALKGVEMAVSEGDLPSPAMSDALRSKYGENPQFAVPGRGVSAGLESFGIASKKMASMFGLTPGNITDAMVNARRAFDETVVAGATPEQAQIQANVQFWKQIPVRYAMMKLGIGRGEMGAVERLVDALKNGDIAASKEMMDAMTATDPALASIFPEIKVEVIAPEVPVEPRSIERLKREKKPSEFNPINDIVQMGGIGPDTVGVGELFSIDAPRKIFNKDSRSGLDHVRESWVERGILPEDATLNDVLEVVRKQMAGEKASESMLDVDAIDRRMVEDSRRIENMKDEQLQDELSQWTSILGKEGKLYAKENERLIEISDELSRRRQDRVEIANRRAEKAEAKLAEIEKKKVEDAEYEEFSKGIDSIKEKNDYVKNVKNGTPEENFESEFIANNYEAFSKEYVRQFGNRLSSDAVKTMEFPDRKSFGPEDSLVRQKAAQAFIETKINSLLVDTKRADKPILVTAGITGAGKTTGLGMFGRGPNEYLFELDTNLANYDKAKVTIDKFLRSNPKRQVDVIFTEREPFDAFENGVMQRFYTTERRVVPIESHIYFMGAKNSIVKLHGIFGNHPRVRFVFRDNRGSKTVQTSIDKIKNLVYNESEVRRKANELIQSEHTKGNLSDEEARSFLGNESGRKSGGSDRLDVPGRDAQPEKAERTQPQPPLNPDLPPDGFKSEAPDQLNLPGTPERTLPPTGLESKRPQAEDLLEGFRPEQGRQTEFPPDAGATILLSEAAGRIMDIAKKAKNYADFRRLVSEDVDITDTAKFYNMNLRQMYDEKRNAEESRNVSMSGLPKAVQKILQKENRLRGDRGAGKLTEREKFFGNEEPFPDFSMPVPEQSSMPQKAREFMGIGGGRANLERGAGEHGKALADEAEMARDLPSYRAAEFNIRLEDLAKAGKATKEELFNLKESLEGRAKPESTKVREFFDEIDAQRNFLRSFRDDQLMGTKDLDPQLIQEERRAWGLENYYPHKLPADTDLAPGGMRRVEVSEDMAARKAVGSIQEATQMIDEYLAWKKSGARPMSLARYLVKQGQAKTMEEALIRLERARQFSNNFEDGFFKEREADLPFYDPNPLRVIPEYNKRSMHYLYLKERFGEDASRLLGLVEKTVQKGGSREIAEGVKDWVLGTEKQSEHSRLVRGLLNLQSIEKLSYAGISNFFQGITGSGAALGPRFGMKATWDKMFSKVAPKYAEEMRDFAQQVGQNPDYALLFKEDPGNLTKKMMGISGFRSTEIENYVVSTFQGKAAAMYHFKRLLKNPKDLHARKQLEALRIGVDRALEAKELSKDDILNAGNYAWRKSQGIPDPLTLPLRFLGVPINSDFGRLMFQFKRVAYSSTKLMKDAVGEAATGNPGKLLWLMVAYPAAGTMIQNVKEAIGVRPADRDKDKKALEIYIDRLSAGFAFGILNDLYYSSYLQKFPIGATQDQLIQAGASIMEAVGLKKGWQATGKQVTNVPFVGRAIYNKWVKPALDRESKERAAKTRAEKSGKLTIPLNLPKLGDIRKLK